MDEATLITLNRYLDDDLTAAESQALEARLQHDDVLQAHLDGLKATRLAVQDLADGEAAPDELDRLVDPLIHGRPPGVAARPWARWLATAAGAILGLTVILEVSRQQPVEPPGDRYRSSLAAPGATPTARFSLAPLPTSSLPPEERPVGVSDRLIASPIPEIEIGSSPPLEVVGPLAQPVDADGSQRRRLESRSGAGSTKAFDQANTAPEAPLGDELSEQRNAAGRGRVTESAAESGRRQPARGAVSPDLADRGPEIGAKLFVFLGDRTEWRPFDPKIRCKSGRYALRVLVESGQVVEVWPLGAATSPTPQERLCAAELTMGLTLDAVPDGEHRAEVLIEREDNGR